MALISSIPYNFRQMQTNKHSLLARCSFLVCPSDKYTSINGENKYLIVVLVFGKKRGATK